MNIEKNRKIAQSKKATRERVRSAVSSSARYRGTSSLQDRKKN